MTESSVENFQNTGFSSFFFTLQLIVVILQNNCSDKRYLYSWVDKQKNELGRLKSHIVAFFSDYSTSPDIETKLILNATHETDVSDCTGIKY